MLYRVNTITDVPVVYIVVRVGLTNTKPSNGRQNDLKMTDYKMTPIMLFLTRAFIVISEAKHFLLEIMANLTIKFLSVPFLRNSYGK